MRFKQLAKDLRRLLLPLLLGWLSLSAAQAKEIITYYHNDALGSPIAATDEKGNLIWREEYGPYGERILRQAGDREPMGYTGKPEEAALGLTYFGARWYDPSLGRFLSPDPVPFQEDNPHSFNRYAYGNANPYRYIDPNGESPLDIGFFMLDAVNFGLAVASGNPQAIASAGADLAVSAVGLASPVPGVGQALMAARAADKAVDAAKIANKGGGAVIGRLDDLAKPGALKPGEYTLLDRLPDLGSPKANWMQNSSVLRQEMRNGMPIRDASAHKPDSFLVPTELNPNRTVRQTFTGAERNLLRNKEWTFDGQYWNPPVGR